MAKAKTLKVYRTPIGFHDAYVAAPSQKAALEAWGSSGNLFAQGAAEIITDPKLTKEALARPGEVVRKLRGNEAEQIRALGPLKKNAATTEKSSPKRTKPGRTSVDQAEKAVEAADSRHRSALGKLKAQTDALERQRRELEVKQRSERERLEQAAEQARARYRTAMDEWAG